VKLRDRAIVLGGVVLLALLGGALVATSGSGARPVATPPPSLPAATQRVLDEGIVGDVLTLDPLYATTAAEADLDALLFGGLTRLGPAGRIVPDLAESWKVSAGGKVYDFYLRPEARWHDGVPVTADDVVFTILTLQHPDYDGPAAGPWRDIQVRPMGDRRVRFRLPTAAANFLLVAAQPVVPAHLLAAIPVAERRASGFGRAPVGNGPFRLATLTQREAVLVPAGTDEGSEESASPSLDPLATAPGPTPAAAAPRPRPQLDEYRFHLYPSAAEAGEAFRSGELDALGGVSVEAARSLVASDGVRGIRYPRTVLTSIVLNLRFEQKIFSEPRVRRALLMAIDRQRLVDDLLGGWARIAQTPISPASFVYHQKAAGNVSYDPPGARKLIKAAGWRTPPAGLIPPGRKRPIRIELATLSAETNPLAAAVAERVAADWRGIGLHVRVSESSRQDLVEKKLVPGAFQAVVLDVNLGLDPDLYPLLASSQAAHGGSNVAGYQSRAMDKLLIQARLYAPATDRRERFVALQKELARQMPVLPLFFSDYLYLMRDNLQGPTSREVARPADRFWDVLTWRVADDTQ
jgi:peptide/nickel transport system substrate-binding protein